MPNNDLNMHEAYDSFFASEDETSDFKTRFNVTAKSKKAMQKFLFSLIGFVAIGLSIWLGFVVWEPFFFVSFLGYAVIYGFGIYADVVCIIERTFLFPFLIGATLLISGIPMAVIIPWETPRTILIYSVILIDAVGFISFFCFFYRIGNKKTTKPNDDPSEDR